MSNVRPRCREWVQHAPFQTGTLLPRSRKALDPRTVRPKLLQKPQLWLPSFPNARAPEAAPARRAGPSSAPSWTFPSCLSLPGVLSPAKTLLFCSLHFTGTGWAKKGVLGSRPCSDLGTASNFLKNYFNKV